MSLDFKDTVTLYSVRKNTYGGDVLDEGTEVPALVIQTTAFSRGSRADVIGAGAGTQAKGTMLYLPPDDEFVVTHDQRLEGMVAQVDIYDGVSAQQFYRITGVTPVRDILLDNEVQHVEVELSKIEGFSYVS